MRERSKMSEERWKRKMDKNRNANQDGQVRTGGLLVRQTHKQSQTRKEGTCSYSYGDRDFIAQKKKQRRGN